MGTLSQHACGMAPSDVRNPPSIIHHPSWHALPPPPLYTLPFPLPFIMLLQGVLKYVLVPSLLLLATIMLLAYPADTAAALTLIFDTVSGGWVRWRETCMHAGGALEAGHAWMHVGVDVHVGACTTGARGRRHSYVHTCMRTASLAASSAMQPCRPPAAGMLACMPTWHDDARRCPSRFTRPPAMAWPGLRAADYPELFSVLFLVAVALGLLPAILSVAGTSGVAYLLLIALYSRDPGAAGMQVKTMQSELSEVVQRGQSVIKTASTISKLSQ